ncbi:MAG TPA: Rnf-Nqr domain containing protein [Phycisphaerae bacterium]|nr:Rnf-Nqr domain containing protein [Phycisphaerae bacterium]
MNDTSALVIFVAAVFTNNILLTYFLGMCSFLACSRRFETAIGLGAAVTFVLTSTTILNYGIYYGILVPEAPLCAMDLTHLQYIIFIAVIAAFVQLVEMIIERFSPRLYHALGIFLPLITVNCAILGVALFMVTFQFTLFQAVAFGFGGGVGWTLVIVLLTGLRQKMGYANLPAPFRGVAITMIVTGVMAMAYMGFAGMVSIQ